MLSKEEKLIYAEALRQQIKEKQEAKRNEQRAKRSANQHPVNTQSDRALVPDPNIFNQKQALQQQLQAQDYNPFGKAGSGAPNIKGANQNIATVNQNKSLVHNYQGQDGVITREYIPNTIENIPQNYRNANQNNVNQYPPSIQQHPQKSPPFLASQQILGGGYQQEGSGLHQQYNIPTSPQKAYQQTVQQQSYVQPQRIPQQYQINTHSRVQPQEYQPHTAERQQIQAPLRERIKTEDNDALGQVFKKGGRNLLRLENQTINQHAVKQKQKQQMQAFLKQQMEQAERRKQEEKQRIKREELEEEQRNKQYIQRQNQRLRDQQNKKNMEKQKIVEQNLRNLERKKAEELNAKQKAQRQILEKQQRRQYELQLQKQRQFQQQNQIHHKIELPRNPSSSSVSETSSQATYSKGFNTNISKEFLKKDRERQADRHKNDKKIQMFTHQIQKMKEEIVGQGQVFQKELDKIKRQANQANDEKRKAEIQLQRLKLELQKKNKESELRLLQALKRNDPYNQRTQQPQHHHHEPKQYNSYQYDSLNELEQEQLNDHKPYGIPSKPSPSPPRPMAKAKPKVYEHQPEPEPARMPPRPTKRKMDWQKQFSLQQSNIGTLDADSKKIPLNMQGGGKLTLSSIENVNNGYNFGKSQSQSKAYRDEVKQSRDSKRSDRDELDKLVQNKWQMSTVKDDITNEIQQLLKQKQSKNTNNLQPSQASRLPLSRGGLPYQGPALHTLNSNKASLVSEGTFDLDRIHGRNDARLRQLKALGVQTVNTNNDDDLNRLNSLLNNY